MAAQDIFGLTSEKRAKMAASAWASWVFTVGGCILYANTVVQEDLSPLSLLRTAVVRRGGGDSLWTFTNPAHL